GLGVNGVTVRALREAAAGSGGEDFGFAIDDFGGNGALVSVAEKQILGAHAEGEGHDGDEQDGHSDGGLDDEGAALRFSLGEANHHNKPASIIEIRNMKTARTRLPTKTPFHRTRAVVIS